MKIADMSPEARRAYNAAAKRKERAKLAEKSDKAKAAAIEKQQDEHEKFVRAGRNLHFFGEETSGCDAKTHASELVIHREFARALGQPDVQEGETLRMLAKRVWDAWLVGPYSTKGRYRDFGHSSDGKEYVPAFNRKLQKFDADFGFVVPTDEPFDDLWEPPKDLTGDEVIDVSTLPELPKLAKPMESAPVEPAAPVAPVRAVPVHVPTPNAATFSWDASLATEARRYLDGR